MLLTRVDLKAFAFVLFISLTTNAFAMEAEDPNLPDTVQNMNLTRAEMVRATVLGTYDNDIREHADIWYEAIVTGKIKNPSLRAYACRLLILKADFPEKKKILISGQLIANYARFDSLKARLMINNALTQTPLSQDLTELTNAIHAGGWTMEATWMEQEAWSCWQDRVGNTRVQTIGRPSWKAPLP